MEVDESPAGEYAVNVSPQRTEAFNTIFGQHMRANRLDLINIADLEEVVNTGSDARYSRAEIILLLDVKADVTEGSEKIAQVIGDDSEAVICATGFRPGWDLFAPWKVNPPQTPSELQELLDDEDEGEEEHERVENSEGGVGSDRDAIVEQQSRVSMSLDDSVLRRYWISSTLPNFAFGNDWLEEDCDRKRD
ncbi:hypothetical protein LWI29_007287 [Acer saccharum]|uniref:Uncharacterized protein n=1 Tax=Acer saccharum TaxID=4024 RepID=A0AA39RTH8_ACESA|nr:hypothetical protein LWI29_007287 [Acer saccharum]